MRITVSMGSCGIAAGAARIYELLKEKSPTDSVTVTGCNGMCHLEPIVTVDGKMYTKVGEKDTENILNGTAEPSPAAKFDSSRIALRNCGIINPENIDEYIATGGYAELSLTGEQILLRKKSLAPRGTAARDFSSSKSPCFSSDCGRQPKQPGDIKSSEMQGISSDLIIEQIKISGLAGRGGAGFPTWFKWAACREAGNPDEVGLRPQALRKFIQRSRVNTPTLASGLSPQGEGCRACPADWIPVIICNADEGDPGAFMDRAILEGDPHSVIEGMLIAARAIGSDTGIIYVRAEYPLAIKRLEIAIRQARERGYLGGTKNFDIRIKAGAGAFVCGEETALIASLEGERGMPRLKPPFPAQKGYWGKPSNINNVETFANVPWIIRHGGEAFAAIGTENSKGTKVFALTGKVKKGGLVEVPMGKTVRDVIYDYAGGVLGDKKLKAVQLGGPSGGCIPYELIDTEIDYKKIAETGAIMGSGGMVVMDESTCMVDIARYFLDFTCSESCGKCTHCRIGNKRMLEILERICGGNGKDGDIERLEELCEGIKAGSLCALGQTAPNPVLTTLRYFRSEYEEHIENKKCPAGQCRALLTYSIAPDKCKKCNLCMRKCPAGAISDELIINRDKCTKCGLCTDVCRFKAVEIQ